MGQRLRAVRLAAGFTTAREFAAALEVPENTYTMWERGHRLVHPNTLAKIKSVTGVTADYIYYGEPGGLPLWLVRRLKVHR